MSLRKYVPQIHIHPVLLIFIVIAFLTGTFMQLAIILTIVFIHELGHFVMATAFKWRIRSVMLWVFGGVMDTDEHGNSPVHEDILVTIAGPFQHVIIYIFIYICASNQLLPTSILDLISFYNTVILLFNLLPIWPLDGGRLLFSFISAFVPYRKAYNIIIISSMIVCFILLCLLLFVFPFTLSSFFIIIFLFMENRTEWKERYYVFIRFLLSRYQGNASIKGIHPLIVSHQTQLMDVFVHFRRSKRHPIYVVYPNNERKSVDENDCLRSYFYDKEYGRTIGEIAEFVL